MSKVDELWKTYSSNVSAGIFNKFRAADNTSTHKYLPFLLKVWANKKKIGKNFTSETLINLVRSFELYQNYIEVKDIYNPMYQNFDTLKKTVEDAILKHEEKIFDRDAHIRVLWENENLLMLQPLTHKGSLKYGAATRWCTASKTSESTFNRYVKNGFLAYVISKKEVSGNYSKFALFNEETSNPMGGEVSIYNPSDITVNDSTLVSNGWEWDDVMTCITLYRVECAKEFRKRRAKQDINKMVNTIKNIDLSSIQKNIAIAAGQELDSDLVRMANESLSNLITKLNLQLNK
jgi:hypothetical protein